MPIHAKPHVHVLDQDGSLLSTIEHLRLPGKVVSVADWDQLIARSAEQFGSIAFVRIDEHWCDERLANCLVQIRRATRQVDHVLWMAFGPPPIRRFTREFLRAGMANVYSSHLHRERIVKAAWAWWTSLDWPSESIEQRVARDLPWSEYG